MSRFHDGMTVAEARDVLRTLVDDGHRCPLCTQMAKVYRRRINSTMARTLIRIYHAGGTQHFVHTASLPGDTHEASQLSWWGLIEEERVVRDDGGKAGRWRVTNDGALFVCRQSMLPEYAVIYDSRVLGTEGKLVSIATALGKKFKYDELMAGV